MINANKQAYSNRRLVGIISGIPLLLLIPFVAMQLTEDVSWKVSDFLVMGILLLGTGLVCELVLRKVKELRHRVLFCAVVLTGFLLVWAELAVGIFGTPFAGS